MSPTHPKGKATGKAKAKGKTTEKTQAAVKNRPSRREITRWSSEIDEYLLLAIQQVCNKNGIKIPFDEVAATMGRRYTQGSVVQHLAKLRVGRIAKGLPVPPALQRAVGRARTKGLKETPEIVGSPLDADETDGDNDDDTEDENADDETEGSNQLCRANPPRAAKRAANVAAGKRLPKRAKASRGKDHDENVDGVEDVSAADANAARFIPYKLSGLPTSIDPSLGAPASMNAEAAASSIAQSQSGQVERYQWVEYLPSEGGSGPLTTRTQATPSYPSMTTSYQSEHGAPQATLGYQQSYPDNIQAYFPQGYVQPAAPQPVSVSGFEYSQASMGYTINPQDLANVHQPVDQQAFHQHVVHQPVVPQQGTQAGDEDWMMFLNPLPEDGQNLSTPFYSAHGEQQPAYFDSTVGRRPFQPSSESFSVFWRENQPPADNSKFSQGN